MANTIDPAKRSPRLEDQVFKWYDGDAFTIEWEISLKEDETPVHYDDDDELIFSFYDRFEKNLIHQFTFDHIKNNTVSLVFTEEISKKFPVGKYVYCVKYINHEGERITIFAKNKVEVQACH